MHKVFENIKDLQLYIENLKRSEKKVSLDYFSQLCAFFGNPQAHTPFIHIGGTNGKGSTVTYLKSILLQAGYHVGTYISPYVVCFNERITYNDQYITDEELLHYGNMVISRFPELEKVNLRTPSFFEMMTLIAFLYFADKKDLDVAIIEVGIGGKLDCTNIIKPLVSGVTNVSYDHMDILGNTLEEIWDNKLGIVKYKTPFVTIKTEFLPLASDVCQKLEAPLTIVDKSLITNLVVTDTNVTFDYKEYSHIKLNLLGYHQAENAIFAIDMLKQLPGFHVSKEAILKGLSQAFWPGRLEVVSHHPLIILDGAHNIDGITRLKQFILTIKKNRYLRLVLAVSANKEREKMIEIIEDVADEIIFTHFMYKRSDESMNLFNFSHHPNKKIIDDVDEIIKLSLQTPDVTTIFCGSLFFVSQIRNQFVK